MGRPKQSESISFSDKVADFLTNHRGLILGIVILVGVAFLAFGALSLWNHHQNTEAAATVDRAYLRLERWLELEPQEDRAKEFETEIRRLLEPYVQSRGPTYAGSRALWILSQIEEKLGNEGEQEKLLERLLEYYPDSPLNILATYALLDIRARQGRNEEAQRLLQRLLERPDVPALFKEEALFFLGLLQEAVDPATAKRTWSELIQTYTASDWTKLARSRILRSELAP